VLRALGTGLRTRSSHSTRCTRLGKLSVNPDRIRVSTLFADVGSGGRAGADGDAALGLPNPYEQLKALTRGMAIDADAMRAFIASLELPEDARSGCWR